jgi:hypothetical protein
MTSTVNATGNASINFVYANRLEGQWNFSGGGAVTTVNLHAFNGPRPARSGDRGVGADPIAAAGRPRYGSTLGGVVVTCQQAG